jgi:enoyl-CoA hydratase/carnithine racemase
MTTTRTDYQTIQLNFEGRIARLTLNRPEKLNALDPTMLEELLDALHRTSLKEDTNALFLQGTGRLFSAGVDLDTPFFMEHVQDDSIYSGTRLLNWQHKVIEAIYNLPVVTFAALNGDAVGGGGLGLAMACDLRVSVRKARFWMVPMMLDVIQDFGLSWLVQRQVGPSRALQMALLGNRLGAEQAFEWGLVNELVDDAAALDERMNAIATQIGGMGTDALRMLKLILRNGERSSLREQLGVEAVANGLAFQSREFADKKAAYFSKTNVRKTP